MKKLIITVLAFMLISIMGVSQENEDKQSVNQEDGTTQIETPEKVPDPPTETEKPEESVKETKKEDTGTKNTPKPQTQPKTVTPERSEVDNNQILDEDVDKISAENKEMTAMLEQLEHSYNENRYLEDLRRDLENKVANKNFILIIIVSLFVLLLVAVVLFYFESQKRAKKLQKHYAAIIEDLKKHVAKIEDLQSQLTAVNEWSQAEIERLQKQNETLKARNKENITDQSETEVPAPQQPSQLPLPPEPPLIKLYADAINNKEFYNVTDKPGDLSVYELILTRDGAKASFKVHESAERRVVARPGNLDGCDTDITQGGKSLHTINEGKARQIAGKWTVEVPLKLKII